MALTKCPDCGKSISELAPTCLGCGRPMSEPKLTQHHQNIVTLPQIRKVSSDSDVSVKTYKVSLLAMVAGVLFIIGYFGIFAVIIYVSAGSKDQLILWLASLSAIFYVSWVVLRAAYRVEVGTKIVRFKRIIGVVDVPISDMKSIDASAGWIRIDCGTRNIPVTNVDDISGLISTLKLMNKKIT